MAVVVTITLGGYAYGFDFEDQRIDIDAGLASVDVALLYDAIRFAQVDAAAMVYPLIATGSGRDQLAAGVETFLTVTLQGGWEINTLRTSGRFVASGGNLIRADGGDVFRDTTLVSYQNNTSQAGVIAETGVSGLTPTESAQLAASAAATPAAIRTELDTNSTKLDVAVSTRLATAGYTVPPSAAANATAVGARAIDTGVTADAALRVIFGALANGGIYPAGDGEVEIRAVDGTVVGRLSIVGATRTKLAP